MKSKFLRTTLLTSLAIFFSTDCLAHQPVMDMAPRWEDGFGLQLRFESYGSDELLEGDDQVSNPLDLNRYVERTWLEGVYTFDRAKRVTFKLPYVNQRRTVAIDGDAVRQKDDGLGDLILGVPLKLYKNQGAKTGNLSFTPSLRVPTGSTSGDFPISDGSWDLGLSLSYSTENPKFYQLYDLFYWVNTDGKGGRSEGDELGLDVNWGVHAYHDAESLSGVFLMLDVTARHNEKGDAFTVGASGGTRVQSGPVLVLYRENVMFRAEYKHPVFEDVDGTSLSRGPEVQVGLGITF